jgi:plasmid stability protein
MSHLVLNDVPPEVIDELRRRADQHKCSVADEAKAVLEGSLGLSKARALVAARRLRVRLEGAGESASLIREGRGGAAAGGRPPDSVQGPPRAPGAPDGGNF